jgi:hypothetical protein
MKASWGKVRLGVIAILALAAFVIISLYRSANRAYGTEATPTLFATDNCSDAVTAYPATSNSDVSPLAPAPTGPGDPQFVAIDKNGNIYVTSECSGAVTIYAKGSGGDTAPIATIGGDNTGLIGPVGVALDSNQNIYVTDDLSPISGGGGWNRYWQEGSSRRPAIPLVRPSLLCCVSGRSPRSGRIARGSGLGETV